MRTTKRLLLAFFAVPLLLSACGDPLFSPPSGFGVVEARRNDELWNGYGWAVIVADTLYLTGRRDISAQAGDAEEVRVKVPFNGVGTYQLTTAMASLANIAGGNATAIAPASGQMVLSNYDGIFVVGTMTLTAQTGAGPVTFTARRVDVPVFFSFAEVPPLPVD
jgi:hypothetical protein